MMNTPNRVPVATAKVTNQMQGDKELSFTLTAHSEGAVNNIPMLPGAWRTATERSTPKTGITFSSPDFDSLEQMVNYFHLINTEVYGARIETTNVSNYGTTQNIQFYEKDPSGDNTQPIKFYLSKYRVPVGSSFSEVIELSERQLRFLIWAGLDIQLATLAASSSITFNFKVRGWSKVKELSALPAAIIG